MATIAPPGISIPPPPPSGGGVSGDQQRLVWVLEAIRQVLYSTVHLEPSPFPPELRGPLLDAWPEAETSLQEAAAALRNPARFRRLYPHLRRAGLTGPSLHFKVRSMEYHRGKYLGEILTYPAKPTWRERLARFARPVFKCMNSIMGSLKEILRGLEIAKEYKEHVEASVDALQQGEQKENAG